MVGISGREAQVGCDRRLRWHGVGVGSEVGGRGTGLGVERKSDVSRPGLVGGNFNELWGRSTTYTTSITLLGAS